VLGTSVPRKEEQLWSGKTLNGLNDFRKHFGITAADQRQVGAEVIDSAKHKPISITNCGLRSAVYRGEHRYQAFAQTTSHH
jgi:hypothetical protein